MSAAFHCQCAATPVNEVKQSSIAMCCHSRVIYSTCGHSSFCPRPLLECRDASFDPSVPWSTGCEIAAHPYKSLRLDRLCPSCSSTRERLLLEIKTKQSVKFDEWQWKVSYGMPSGGKDYWTKKAEEREEEDRKKVEPPPTPQSPRRKPSSIKRFSWRKSKRKSAKLSPMRDVDEEEV